MLYVGQLFPGATALSRMNALESAGFLVTPFNTNAYLRWPGRLARAFAHRLLYGSPVWRLNADLSAFAASRGPFDVVWIDKHIWVWRRTLEQLAGKRNATLVHYTPDPQLVFHRSRHFRSCISVYDIVVTTKEYELQSYRRYGARHLILSEQGADDSFLYPELPYLDRRTDIAFVGHFEPHYAKAVNAAISTGLCVQVFGNGWRRYFRKHPSVDRAFGGDSMYFDSYRTVLGNARMALGLLSKLAPDVTTTRSFEIPACQTLLLSERTAALESYYSDREEAVFFDSPEELAASAVCLASDPHRAGMIAAAGYQRFVSDGYSIAARMRQLLAEMELA